MLRKGCDQQYKIHAEHARSRSTAAAAPTGTWPSGKASSRWTPSSGLPRRSGPHQQGADSQGVDSAVSSPVICGQCDRWRPVRPGQGRVRLKFCGGRPVPADDGEPVQRAGGAQAREARLAQWLDAAQHHPPSLRGDASQPGALAGDGGVALDRFLDAMWSAACARRASRSRS